MNYFAFRIAMFLIVFYLVALVSLGFWLGEIHSTRYTTFKDMAPILIAIAAAVLTGCIQRRIAFLAEVRKLYGNCVSAIESAIQYTHMENPKQTDFAAVYKELATTIELFRASFRNAGDGHGQRGLYPFEALKSIIGWHCYLGFGSSFRQSEARKARTAILELWQDHLRPPILAELDRWTPRRFVSHYWGRGVEKDWPLAPKPEKKSYSLPKIEKVE